MDEWIIHLYKSKGGFAKNTLETRRSTAVEKRREYRNSVLTQLRQIPQIMSPLHLEEKIEVSQEKPKKSKRMEMLEKWKKEKEKKQFEAKKKSKPVFKVCRVKSHEDLNEVYSSIKGKKIIKDKAASSIQFDIEKKIPKSTSHVLASNIANSHGDDKILQDKKLMRIDKKANAKSTEKYSTNKGNLKSSLVPHRSSQASSSGSGILKKTKPPSINNTGDLVKNKKLENGSITKKLAKISNHKSSINIATNGEMNSQDKKKYSEVPKRKTPAIMNHTSTSAEIEKLNISISHKSQKSASQSQPSTSSFDNASPPCREQTYTETQTEHYTPTKSGKLNISTNNKSLKSASRSQPSTSSFNNSSKPHVTQKYTEKQKKHIDTPAKIGKLNISTNNKSLKSAGRSQPSTSSFNNSSIPLVNQKYTEKQTKHIDTPAKIGKLNISSNNKSRKSAPDNQGSTSRCNNASTPKVRQTYTETQTVIEKPQSPFMSFAESILPISANQTIVTNDTICNNDYTLRIEHTNNSTEQIENKSLRISLQKMNIKKKIESERNSIQENGFERSVENLSETEKRIKERTPTGRNSEYMKNCFVNLSPLNPNLYMMESTPLPNHFEKIMKTRGSIRTSRLSSKNQTEILDKEFNLSVENMESVQSNKSTKKTKSIDKKRKSVSHQQLDIPDDISIISTPNEGKIVSNKSSSDIRNSIKSSRKKRSPSETKRNSTRYSVSLNVFPSEGALNEGETPDTSASVRLTRRRSRRVLDMMKKNSSTIEIESTFTKESRENRRSKSNKSRTSISNTSTPAWNLRINDTYEENTRNNSVKKSKTKKRKSVPISHSNDETYFRNKSASDKEGGDTVFETPKLTKDNEEVIAYISPFVTTSRGKTAARKEYNMRKSLEGFNSSIAGSTDPKSPKAAAAYFERILNREIVRIQELCEAWQSYKESGNVSDDACGLIDMTIGQSNLLISKKFNQFRGLIEKSRNNDESEMKVQCEDLHGFWDMIFKQVQDLDKRFENLEDMKKNNWLEDVPRKKTPLKKVPKKKKGGRSKSTTEASSLLKKAIMAGRKKKAQSKSEGNLEIIIAKKNTTPDHKILANSSMLNFENNSSTPARGILKSVSARSEKRKTVAFVEALTNGGQKENMISPSFIRKDTPRPTRRSDRGSLGRSKLVFE